MRISDWSSDVWSSDLAPDPVEQHLIIVAGLARGHLGGERGHVWQRTERGRIEQPVEQFGAAPQARKRVVYGTSVSGRVDLGGRRIIKKQHLTSTKIDN